MHEVAETGTSTFSHLVLTTTSFTEICDWRKFGVNGPRSEPAIVQIIHSFLSIFFSSELDVHVADKMITKIVANIHLFNLSVFVFHLNEDIFEESCRKCSCTAASLITGIPGMVVVCPSTV